jgi:hypothetical protein
MCLQLIARHNVRQYQDGDEATLCFDLKGGRVKTRGIHFAAAGRDLARQGRNGHD